MNEEKSMCYEDRNDGGTATHMEVKTREESKIRKYL